MTDKDEYDSMEDSEDEEGAAVDVTPLSNGDRPPAVAKFEIPFSSSREAEVACNSLRVDPEPKRSGSTKKYLVRDNILCVEVQSPDVRQLRTAVTSFMDLLHLVSKTIDQFGPPVQQSKKLCS